MREVLATTAPDFEARFAAILARGDSSDGELEDRVAAIIEAVRTRGDAALVELTAELDDRPGVTLRELVVPQSQLQVSLQNLPTEVKGALSRAAGRIRAFHGLQRAQIDDTILDDGRGLRAELRVQALSSVGIYVPGGTAAYPSTVLMNGIPAKVTGVPEVAMTTPAKGGKLAPAVLAAACLADVDRVITVGGAQAIAALAFGTETVPRVDKIVGPGNAYVAEAKRQVFGRVDIDQIAGPSEVLIIADNSADPRLVAADLLAQAEHDVHAAALAVVWSEPLAEAIAAELEVQLAALPRSEIAAGRDRSARRRDPRARSGGGDRARKPLRTGAPGPCGRRAPRDAGGDPPRRRGLPRTLHTGGARRLQRRREPRAPDRRHRPLRLAAVGPRLRAPDERALSGPEGRLPGSARMRPCWHAWRGSRPTPAPSR